MISGILQAPDAMRSRGGKMFHRCKQSAENWSKEAMGKKFEQPYGGSDAGEFVTGTIDVRGVLQTVVTKLL